MIRWFARAAGLASGIGGLALLAVLSGWRYHANPDDHALLRLALSARPERLEHCRQVSEAELAEQPVHMRQRIQCVGKAATYRLHVRLDSQTITDRVLRGGGLRHDRPLSLLVEHPVQPGAHHLAVRLERVEAIDSNAVVLVDSTRRARQPPLPARLSLGESQWFEARRVVLVSYDIEHRRLVIHTRPGTGDQPSPTGSEAAP